MATAEESPRSTLRGTRSVTMLDVAERAGVSRTAVSFVLNNRPNASIPPETRRRILDAVVELGYRPNAGARALAVRRSDWFGIVTEIVTAPFASTSSREPGPCGRPGQFLMITSSESEAA